MELGSMLSHDAAAAGRNFLNPAIHAFVRRELIMREDGAAYDEDRLLRNALSSMPLCQNLFAPLAMNHELATATFKQLLPHFVHRVTRLKFEHSPGRRERRFLDDGTAWDLAVQVITPDGEDATIFIEVKYSEDMSGPAARWRGRYDEVLRSCGLFIDPESVLLRSLALEQLFREHALSQLVVDQGLTSKALFVAIGPRLNRRVMAAFRVYETELIPADDQDSNRVPFVPLTLESVIDAIGEAGAIDISKQLWARYADFERIYQLSLAEYDDCVTQVCEPSRNSTSQLTAARPSPVKARRRANAANAKTDTPLRQSEGGE